MQGLWRIQVNSHHCRSESDIVRMLGGECVKVNTLSFQNDMRTYLRQSVVRISSLEESLSYKRELHTADPLEDSAGSQDTAAEALPIPVSRVLHSPTHQSKK